MQREVLTTAIFQENCEYESSTNTRKIAIPKQTVEIDIVIKDNISSPTRKNTPQYNDKLQFMASVYQTYIGEDNKPHKNPITVGRIQFFYLADGTKTPIQLNPDDENEIKKTCLLNNQGNTSIIYRPNRNGQIFAKYIDDNNFYETATSTYLDVNLFPIDVKISIDAPPILTNVNDEIELTAHVTRKDSNEPIQYGVVTFVHYQTTEDIDAGTNERVIGNPVMVEEDGTATIRYIPVQTDNDNEPYSINPPYKENIRVIYNYSNKLYGEQWKYYKEASVWTQIAVCARDSITIGLDSTNIDSRHGQHQYDELDDIHLYGIITNKNNNTFPIKQSGTYKANLTFHIKGVHVHPKRVPSNLFQFNNYIIENENYQIENNNFNYVEYSEDVNATYNEKENKYYFDTTINNLLPGYYTITASCKEQEGTDDKMYDAVDISNVLYVQVNFISASPVIQLSADKNTIRFNEKVPNIKGEIVANLSNNQKSILNGQSCDFYIPKLNKRYIGTLIFDDESKKLIGTPNSDISFEQIGTYLIYMEIPTGIYTKNFSTSAYHGHYGDYLIISNNSNALLVQVEDNPEITLKIDKPKTSSVHYTITGANISKPTNINIYLIPVEAGNISMINTITLTPEIYEISDDIMDLDPGDYKIQLEIQNSDTTVIKNFSIPINILNSTIDDNSKNILGTPQNTISAFLYSKESLQSINTNKIKAYIQSAETDFNIQNATQATIQSTKFMKDGSLNVIVKTGLYEKGEWWLALSYEGGGGFSPIVCKEQKFTTFLHTPNIKLIPCQNGYYDIKICYNNNNFIDNNALVIHCLFVKNNTEVASGVIITNKEGYGSFDDNKNNNLNWWNDWNKLILSFSPYYEEDINILKNPPAYNALKNKYGYVFDAYNITTTNPQYNIKAQIIGNEERALYIGYEPSSRITIIRPLS